MSVVTRMLLRGAFISAVLSMAIAGRSHAQLAPDPAPGAQAASAAGASTTDAQSQGDPAQVVGAGNLSYTFNRFISVGAGITSLTAVRSTEARIFRFDRDTGSPDQSPGRHFRGFRHNDLTAESDTLWVNCNRSCFSSHSMAF